MRQLILQTFWTLIGSLGGFLVFSYLTGDDWHVLTDDWVWKFVALFLGGSTISGLWRRRPRDTSIEDDSSRVL